MIGNGTIGMRCTQAIFKIMTTMGAIITKSLLGQAFTATHIIIEDLMTIVTLIGEVEKLLIATTGNIAIALVTLEDTMGTIVTMITIDIV